MAKRSYRRRVRYKPLSRGLRGGRDQRIRIPQTPERPFDIRQRDLIKWEFVQPDPPWFVLHRRGPHRGKVGLDPLEARAVPRSQVRGFLRERIVWLALVKWLRLVPNVDFTFQSSREGGRMQLGGLVVDFLGVTQKWCIQVQGPTHREYARAMKDREQTGILEAMGYTVWNVDIKTVDNEFALREWLFRRFNLYTSVGGTCGTHEIDDVHVFSQEFWLMLLNRLTTISGQVTTISDQFNAPY